MKLKGSRPSDVLCEIFASMYEYQDIYGRDRDGMSRLGSMAREFPLLDQMYDFQNILRNSLRDTSEFERRV